MPEERGLYPKMKVGEQVAYFARLHGLSRQDAAAAVDRWLGALDHAAARPMYRSFTAKPDLTPYSHLVPKADRNAVNVAVQAARAGADVRYFGAVGPDQDGRLTREVLLEQGVNVEIPLRTLTVVTGVSGSGNWG